MVIVKNLIIELAPYGEAKYLPQVVCADMTLSVPLEEHRLTLEAAPSASQDLMRLLSHPGFASASSRVQQYSVWTIRENPERRSSLRALGRFNGGQQMTEEELAEMRTLSAGAGIESRSYRIFS